MDNPAERLVRYSYDSASRLTAGVDGQGTVHVMNYDADGNPKGVMRRADAAIAAATKAARHTVRRFVRTFEFRLSGSEEAKRSMPLPTVPASDCLMAATQAVRISVTRSPQRATASIGGVEVHAEVRGEQVICVARVTDFSPDDLVVVQANVIVCSEQVLPRE